MTTGSGQRIAIVGSGVDEVQALQGKIDMRVDLAPQSDARQESGRPDCLGTGTAIAGIIAAKKVSGRGFRGLAPGAQLLAAKVLGDDYPRPTAAQRSLAPTTLAAGINWAVDNDATIIAVGEVSYRDHDELRSAVRRARDAGIVVIAPVGDVIKDHASPSAPTFPAEYEGVIGIGAIDEGGAVTYFSRPRAVDVVAPGEDVITIHPVHGLGPASGTGIAVGYAAATIALLRSYLPNLSPTEIAHRLRATAAPAKEATGSAHYGFGLINPRQAVLEKLTDDEPAQMPSMKLTPVPPDELARREDTEESKVDAYTFTGIAAGALVLTLAIMVFGPSAVRRRWRSGLAAAPDDSWSGFTPEPPVHLLDEKTPP